MYTKITLRDLIDVVTIPELGVGIMPILKNPLLCNGFLFF